MLCRALPRTLALGGARSPALLSLAMARKEARVGHRKPQVCPGSVRLPSHRCLSSGLCVGCRDPGGYANDPQVKEWMKELQQDFHHQPQESSVGVKTEAGKESQEEDVVDDKTDEGKKRQDKSKGTGVWSQLVADKYQRLESHTQIIYDYDEEILRRDAGLVEEKVKPEKIKLQRGELGVFDLEELVDLLREDRAEDMVVIQIPRELKYTDYMVIVSSSSQRHRNALAELVRAAYKLKKAGRDPSVQTEGKGTNWVAMDMGNIVLHIMKPDTRESYDLETLWTVGAAFDEKAQVSEEDLVGVRRPRDPFGRPLPPPIPYPHQAVT